MLDVQSRRKEQPWFRRLYLPAYRISEAARYTNAHPSTISAWHHRGVPVLSGHERGKALSYMELVEVAFVAFFRKMGVALRRIREARSYIGKILESEYPFTEYKFKTEGMHILMDYYEHIAPNAGEKDTVIVLDARGQLAWGQLLGEKFAQFDYEHEIALRWHPAGRDSLVQIDPRIAFGAPMVQGVPTWVVKGRHNAGESIEEIIVDFDLSKKAVFDALAFEGIDIAALAA